LSTVLDDFSRFIIAWKLCTTMKAQDVSDTLAMAPRSSAARVRHRPRLLSDNGSSYIAGNLAEWLKDNGFNHIRGAPLHPQTQGKIERWHQTLKNRMLLENYIANLTPADVYFGRGQTILLDRERIKRQTI
jgi:transposase InsO family protein